MITEHYDEYDQRYITTVTPVLLGTEITTEIYTPYIYGQETITRETKDSISIRNHNNHNTSIQQTKPTHSTRNNKPNRLLIGVRNRIYQPIAKNITTKNIQNITEIPSYYDERHNYKPLTDQNNENSADFCCFGLLVVT